MDTIFRETGWYTGADGKWRFEIDDSGMEYSRWGDLRREDRAEYARFRELEGKFIDGSITMDEQNELRQLLEEGHGAGRAEEQQTLRLPDFVRHDELYQNYPQLRQAGLRFSRLPEGTRGTFDGQDIILDESPAQRTRRTRWCMKSSTLSSGRGVHRAEQARRAGRRCGSRSSTQWPERGRTLTCGCRTLATRSTSERA